MSDSSCLSRFSAPFHKLTVSYPNASVNTSHSFWGAERKFWEADGVYTTSVGYAGGKTENPTYRSVCSGRTGHAEVSFFRFFFMVMGQRVSRSSLQYIFCSDTDNATWMCYNGRYLIVNSTGCERRIRFNEDIVWKNAGCVLVFPRSHYEKPAGQWYRDSIS